MTRDEFVKWRAGPWGASCSDILVRKGADYSAADDIFDNFKRHANELDVTPEKIWAVYASKHWDAVITYVRTGAVQSEPILDRLRDLRNYVDLLAAHISGEQKS